MTVEIVIPGMLTFEDYLDRRQHYDKMLQCISLDGQFYKGPEERLFPEEWLIRAKERAEELRHKARMARAIGVDTAEGGDDTTWAATDELGLIALIAEKTPDTSVIPGRTMRFVQDHKVAPENVVFDRGGGGKEHADRLRRMGYPVRTVGFGEAVTAPIKSGITTMQQKRELSEERYAYKNRRAEMYGELSDLLNPSLNSRGYAIPAEYTELFRQLRAIPKWYDDEGRLYLPPKQAKGATEQAAERMGRPTKVVTLQSLLGCSPDEADAVVLAVHGMLHKPPIRTAGVVG